MRTEKTVRNKRNREAREMTGGEVAVRIVHDVLNFLNPIPTTVVVERPAPVYEIHHPAPPPPPKPEVRHHRRKPEVRHHEPAPKHHDRHAAPNHGRR